jgi:hypothetical protein
MNKISLKLGYWSALISAATFIIWIISFAGIAVTSPLFTWTNLPDYLDYINSNGQFFQYLAKSFMIVFSISFLLVMISLGELVSKERKVLAKAGIVFTILFSLLSGLHYFIQVSSVRWAIVNGNLEGIQHFLQADPQSFMVAANMLGWTLFLGLGSLFMSAALKGEVRLRLVRIVLLINGISCLAAGFGYLAQIDIITFFFINLGVGAALLVLTVSYARLTRKEVEGQA